MSFDYIVTDEVSWNALPTPLTDKTINIATDFSFSSSQTVKVCNNCVIEGSDHVITMNITYSGLINMFGTTIQNLIIDSSNGTVSNGPFISSTQAFNIQYGNLINCHSRNITLNTPNSGGLVGRYFGNSTTESIIDKGAIINLQVKFRLPW